MPSVTPEFKPLEALVKKATQRTGVSLTAEEAQVVKTKTPAVFQKYQELRKAYSRKVGSLLKSYCGSKIKPFPPLEAALERQGFGGSLPKGFTGDINAAGDLFMPNGDIIAGRPAANNFPKVRMNKEWGDSDSSWVFQAMRPDGSPGPHFYTQAYKKEADTLKYEKVKAVNVPGIRNKWLPHVKKFAPTSDKCVGSAILEMLWQFTARIGTTGRSTYGVSTILVKHVKKVSGGFTITYSGKDGVRAQHKLVSGNVEHKPLIKIMAHQLEGKDAGDRVWTYDKLDPQGNVSVQYLVTATYVNKLWKANGGGETTVHKIRTYTASKLFEAEMVKSLAGSRPKNRTQALAEFKRLAEIVGTLLRHVKRTKNGEVITGSTALKSYIDPALQITYWSTLGFQLPKVLEPFSHP